MLFAAAVGKMTLRVEAVHTNKRMNGVDAIAVSHQTRCAVLLFTKLFIKLCSVENIVAERKFFRELTTKVV